MYGASKNKTIYGGIAKRTVYGGGCTPDAQASCDYKPILQRLKILTQSVFSVVAEFFPATTINSTLIGALGGTAGVSPVMFVRLYWIKTHPGQKLTNSEMHQLEIIDIYLQFPPLDWKTDQYITVKLNE
jgi:hypothetical protein